MRFREGCLARQLGPSMAQKRTIFCHPKTINIKLRPKTDYSYGCLKTSGNLFEPPAPLEAARKPPETLDKPSRRLRNPPGSL